MLVELFFQSPEFVPALEAGLPSEAALSVGSLTPARRHVSVHFVPYEILRGAILPRKAEQVMVQPECQERRLVQTLPRGWEDGKVALWKLDDVREGKTLVHVSSQQRCDARCW